MPENIPSDFLPTPPGPDPTVLAGGGGRIVPADARGLRGRGAARTGWRPTEPPDQLTPPTTGPQLNELAQLRRSRRALLADLHSCGWRGDAAQLAAGLRLAQLPADLVQASRRLTAFAIAARRWPSDPPELAPRLPAIAVPKRPRSGGG